MESIDEYRIAIRKHFEKQILNDDFEFSTVPTPTQLKSRALSLLSENIPESDRGIIKRFFKLDEQKDGPQQIDAFPLQLLRPVQTVYDGTKNSIKEQMLDFAALAVDFEPRPFRKFRKSPSDPAIPAKEPSPVKNPDRPDDSFPPEVVSEESTQKPSGNPKVPNDLETPTEDVSGKNRKPLFIAISILAIVALIALIAKFISVPECMEWKTDHYVRVACVADTTKPNNIEVFRENQFKVRRIPVSKTTVFFKDGRPILWYLKHDSHFDFFDRGGHHPILKDRELKRVSRTIAMQVVDGGIVEMGCSSK